MNLAHSAQPITSRRLDWLVIVLALLIRSLAMFALYDDLAADPDGYRGIARLLGESGEYRRPVDYAVESTPPATIVTSYRPPLYPLLLAAIRPGGQVGEIEIAVLHLLLGVVTVWLSYRLGLLWLGEGRRQSADPDKPFTSSQRWSLAGAMLIALDPILLRQASLVMTETLATLLTVLGLLALTRYGQRRDLLTAAIAGGVLGVACLCRPTFLPWLALIAAGLLVQSLFMKQSLAKWSHALALGAVAGLMLLPWMLRNQAHWGRPIVATTHGGYTLLLGNNPEFYTYLQESQPGELWDAERSDMAAAYRRVEREHPTDEPAVDRWANARAREHIGRQPLAFGYASLVRVGRLWQLMPHKLQRSESTLRFFSRLAVGVWYFLLFACAVVGIGSLHKRLGRSPWLWGLLLLISLTALHAIYWSNMRMRAPAMPVVCLLAVVGLRRLSVRV